MPAAVDGLVREVIVVDGGSSDRTREIADQAGAELIAAPPNRGAQMRAGANAARHPWLLFLNADTVLDAGWEREAAHFMERVDSRRARAMPPPPSASRSTTTAFAPRALEGLVRLRCATLRLPYGDQGLLIARSAYDEAGGHRAVPLMEDVDLVRRIGLRRVKLLRSRAVSDAARYRRDGYLRRALGNQAHRILYALHLAPARPSRLSSGDQ